MPEWSYANKEWEAKRTHQRVTIGTGKAKRVVDQWAEAVTLRNRQFADVVFKTLERNTEDNDVPVWYSFYAYREHVFTEKDYDRRVNIHEQIELGSDITAEEFRWYMSVLRTT